MKQEVQQQHPEHPVIVKLAHLIDAILFIEHEGGGSSLNQRTV